MLNMGQSKRRGVAIMILLMALLAPASISFAEGDTGAISGSVFDRFSWLEIDGICATATSQADGSTYQDERAYSHHFYLDDLPLGLYDVTVTDCGRGIYASRDFEDIEVVSPTGYRDLQSASSNLTVFMTLEGAAVVIGRVVEDYSGYPIEWKLVELVNPHTGQVLADTCTDDDGWYQFVATAGVPVHVRYRNGCGGDQPSHLSQWFPLADSVEDAVAVIPQTGSHTIAHAALTVAGGFVGTILDPTGQVPGYGWKVVAKEGYYLSSAEVRQDGSFSLTRIGEDILIRMEPTPLWDGIAWGYLTDPSNPSVAATWDVGSKDLFDLGWMLLDRPAALSGRVLDTDGYPVQGAVVSFFAEDEHGSVPSVIATTDELGWYVTNGNATGRYTAVAAVASSDHEPWFEFNGTWLGNTPERSRATVLQLDGSSRGGINFIVKRGEASGIDPIRFTWTGPEVLTTDRERNGATPTEPIEITTSIDVQAPASVGSILDPGLPGFVSFGLGASIIHDPSATAPPLLIEFALEPSLLPGAADDMQVVWNGRRLGDCAILAAPCLQGLEIDDRGDLIVSALVTDGGEASFLWGSRFLDTGASIFRDDIEWLADEGITRGCSPPINDLFCPNDEVTRGQMAAFLVRFLGLTDRGNRDFIDDDGLVFEADIEKLAAAGITHGCNPPTNDQFCPDDPVTREQMAAFLTRALELPAVTGMEFTDDDGSIFEDAIERLATAGITRGCNPPANDHFCPSATVTREQMAAFLHRADALATTPGF